MAGARVDGVPLAPVAFPVAGVNDDVPPIGAGEAREPDAKDAGVGYAFSDGIDRTGETDIVAPQPLGPDNPPRLDPPPTQVARKHPTVTQPPAPDNDGRYFPGLRVEPGTPAEPYQVAAQDGEPDKNLVNVTMETYAQDRPSSCMACHHTVANSLGRDFSAILNDAR